MITVYQSPDLNAVLPDGNDNIVIVHSDSGSGYYMRMEVKVNDVAFSTRSISIDANGYARFNFKKFYDDYFVNSFTTNLITGFTTKPGLMAKLTVTFTEYDLEDDTENATITLDSFFIIKSSQAITSTSLSQSFYFSEIKAPENAVICIPVYIKQGFPNVKVTDLEGNVLWSKSDAFPQNSPGQCVVNLSDISIPENITRLKVILENNATPFKSISLYLLKNTHYPPKRIFYKSDEGIYATAYLSGQLQDERGLSPESYIDNDGNEVTYEVNEQANITIEAGYRYAAGADIVRAVAISNDVRIFHEDNWKRATSQTKKMLVKVDNQFVYEDTLKFSITM